MLKVFITDRRENNMWEPETIPSLLHGRISEDAPTKREHLTHP